MMNLLDETLQILKDNGLTENDVKWVGTNDVYTTWEDFKSHANTDYDNGFGAQEVASDLLIVGDNWWLERSEFDGAEDWDYKTLPTQPTKRVLLKALTVNQSQQNGFRVSCGWETLEEINNNWKQ